LIFCCWSSSHQQKKNQCAGVKNIHAKKIHGLSIHPKGGNCRQESRSFVVGCCEDRFATHNCSSSSSATTTGNGHSATTSRSAAMTSSSIATTTGNGRSEPLKVNLKKNKSNNALMTTRNNGPNNEQLNVNAIDEWSYRGDIAFFSSVLF
jgi:hypothetical protein